MNKQPEALELAERLGRYKLVSGYAWYCHKAAALLRTQHADLERKDALLRQALNSLEEAHWKLEHKQDRKQRATTIEAIRKEIE